MSLYPSYLPKLCSHTIPQFSIVPKYFAYILFELLLFHSAYIFLPKFSYRIILFSHIPIVFSFSILSAPHNSSYSNSLFCLGLLAVLFCSVCSALFCSYAASFCYSNSGLLYFGPSFSIIGSLYFNCLWRRYVLYLGSSYSNSLPHTSILATLLSSAYHIIQFYSSAFLACFLYLHYVLYAATQSLIRCSIFLCYASILFRHMLFNSLLHYVSHTPKIFYSSPTFSFFFCSCFSLYRIATLSYFYISNTGFNDLVGRLAFVSFFISSNLLFFPLHSLGIMGFPRRVFDFPISFYRFNWLSSISLIGIGLSLCLFLLSFYL